MTQPLLAIDDLVVTVSVDGQAVPAVRGLSLHLAAGASLGLVGESGCGKSLTALSIMRLADTAGVRTASGTIRLRGEDLISATESRLCDLRGNHLSMIFQDPAAALNPVMNVGRQIAEALWVHGKDEGDRGAARTLALLHAVGIPDPAACAVAHPHQLSGGMKQRVVIAMALACDPALVIADEPTTALDVTIQAQILDLLDRQRRERNMGMIFVSHDLAVVAQVCDEIAVMYAGKIVEQGPTTEVLTRPQHPYTRGMLDALGSVDAKHGETGRRELHEIAGTVPSLRELARHDRGCAFAERCTRVLDRCRDEQPQVTAAGPNHTLRCHNPLASG